MISEGVVCVCVGRSRGEYEGGVVKVCTGRALTVFFPLPVFGLRVYGGGRCVEVVVKVCPGRILTIFFHYLSLFLSGRRSHKKQTNQSTFFYVHICTSNKKNALLTYNSILASIGLIQPSLFIIFIFIHRIHRKVSHRLWFTHAGETGLGGTWSC